MKKSELKQIIREEIQALDESVLDGIDKGLRPAAADKIFSDMARQDKKYSKLSSTWEDLLKASSEFRKEWRKFKSDAINFDKKG